ncbi:Leucine-rich repeat domain superfamily protein [Abortiporus biennis]
MASTGRLETRSYSCINSLPQELLINIFLFVIAPRNDRIWKLSSVCKHWRAVILETPLIWSYITLNFKENAEPSSGITGLDENGDTVYYDEVEAVEDTVVPRDSVEHFEEYHKSLVENAALLWFKRSSPAYIHLSLIGSWKAPWLSATIPEIMSNLALHAARLHSLSIMFDSSSVVNGILQFLSQTEFPAIDSLRIALNSHFSDNFLGGDGTLIEDISECLSKMPNLHSLSFQFCTVDFTSIPQNVFSNLRKVSLRIMNIPVEAVLHILHHSPRLEELYLNYALHELEYFAIEDLAAYEEIKKQVYESHIRPTNFPSLKSLSLINTGLISLEKLLHSLTLPNLETFHMTLMQPQCSYVDAYIVHHPECQISTLLNILGDAFLGFLARISDNVVEGVKADRNQDRNAQVSETDTNTKIKEMWIGNAYLGIGCLTKALQRLEGLEELKLEGMYIGKQFVDRFSKPSTSISSTSGVDQGSSSLSTPSGEPISSKGRDHTGRNAPRNISTRKLVCSNLRRFKVTKCDMITSELLFRLVTYRNAPDPKDLARSSFLPPKSIELLEVERCAEVDEEIIETLKDMFPKMRVAYTPCSNSGSDLAESSS